MRSFLSLLVLGLAACGVAADDDTATAPHEVVYGTDDRREIPFAGLHLYAKSMSVALAAKRSVLGPPADGRHHLATKRLGERLGLCPGERFSGQGSALAGVGTGFLVAPDVMLTARHVVSDVTKEDLVFVFGFELAVRTGDASTVVSEQDVYRAVDVFPSPSGLDLALVKLDRPSTRPPLAVRKSGAPPAGADVVVLGHPSALPMKVSPGKVHAATNDLLLVDADTFGGNSGSPVLNAETLEVEGVLVGGAFDYERTATGCSTTVQLTGFGEERVVPASAFVPRQPP